MANIELPEGACKADLLKHLEIPEEERGYLFINAVLCDVPGLSTGNGQLLHDGDHVGIFSVDRIWPYQYRDGVVISEELKAALQVHGAMHHSYSHLKQDPE
ncbi:MAG: MoaD/ThiS family protein [Chloroflexota bacterium]